MSAEERRPWSLASRITIWFAITTAVLGAAIWGSSAWYLNRAVERELQGLLREEFDELEALMAGTDPTPEAFRLYARRLSEDHPTNRLSWRVWDVASGRVWAEWLALPIEVRTMPEGPENMARLSDVLRWGVSDVQSGLRVGLMIDGSPQLAVTRRTEISLFAFVGLSVVLSTLGGAFFGRRVAATLRRVAEEVRSVRRTDERVGADEEGAPEEIREVLDALRAMLANIRTESENARLIAAGLAHELRSPIQNLLGETEVALLRERSTEYYRGVLLSNQEELRELGRAVDNLVTLFDERRGEARELERFDLAREADLRLARERQAALRHGVDVELRVEGDMTLMGDREALLLALRNLVANAIDWSPSGGVVQVRLRGERDALELEIQDSGPGIPEDEREVVFEPFRRGRAAAGRRSGYGLGLALVKRAVSAHGGEVAVDAGQGGGALFRIRLPRNEPALAAGEDAARPGTHPAAGAAQPDEAV